MNSFSENLSRIMGLRGLNQVELAKKAGIDQPSLSSYINESSRAKFPSLQTMIKLANALNCSLDELAGRGGIRSAQVKPQKQPGLEPELEQLLDGFKELGDENKELLKKMIKAMKKGG